MDDAHGDQTVKPAATVKLEVTSSALRANRPGDLDTFEWNEDRHHAVIHALRRAHSLIVASIEHRPLDFNDLENYFSEMNGLMAPDYTGVLLGAFLDDLCEEQEDAVEKSQPEQAGIENEAKS